MTQENKDRLLRLLHQHKALGISDQIDFDKFYLYSIITHSTAIEGSTVTEVEAQLLFDEGITSSKRTMLEQQMNLDLKVAYDYGREWICRHEPITTDWLVLLASKVMARTGSEYHSIGGDFSAAKGELRKLNVTAGAGGKSYMVYQKVPARLAAFCEELNRRRKAIDPADVAAVYDLSFWAHFELVTIHPWADGNGRTCRLLMNLLQMEFGVLPTKVLIEDKATYIQALIDTREAEDITIFQNDKLEGQVDSGSSIVPLAFPMYAGPGAFTALLAITAEYSIASLCISLLLCMVVLYLVLIGTNWLTKYLGATSLYIIRKFFGIIVLAIACKLMFGNLAAIF